MHEFVCEVIDGMAQNFKSVPGLGSNGVRRLSSSP